MKSILWFIIILLYPRLAVSADELDTGRLYGVTIDNITYIDEITESLFRLERKPTARIVFDCWQSPSYYSFAVDKIHKVSFIMGEIADSYCFAQYNTGQYEARLKEYLNSFSGKVDIWEIGNEINGEWLGNTGTVVEKMKSAFRIVKDKGKCAALTLYYNLDCYQKPENEMFTWVLSNVPQNMKDSLDFVFVSYYEDDCNDFQPDWQNVFDSLNTIFPNSKLGIGECGTKISEKKSSFMKRYYSMRISTPNFVGGYFWWYYKQDCVPYTKELWSIFNSILMK